MARSYHSPAREQKAAETRAQILDALVALLVAEGIEDLSVRTLAARAGVSERTVYRYFPDRPALLDGLGEFVAERVQWNDPADFAGDLEDLAELVIDNYASYERYPDEVRALALLSADPARTSKLSKRNQDVIRDAIARAHPDMPAEVVQVFEAALHVAASSRTWLRYRDEFGLSAEQAARAARRSVRAIIAEFSRQPAMPS